MFFLIHLIPLSLPDVFFVPPSVRYGDRVSKPLRVDECTLPVYRDARVPAYCANDEAGDELFAADGQSLSSGGLGLTSLLAFGALPSPLATFFQIASGRPATCSQRKTALENQVLQR